MVELSVRFSCNIEAANARKRSRYEILTSDIKETGSNCINMALEVGSRGHLTSRNRETLLFLCHAFGIRKISKPYDNPFWDFNKKRRKRRRSGIITRNSGLPKFAPLVACTMF
jgi:hypothetical protein